MIWRWKKNSRSSQKIWSAIVKIHTKRALAGQETIDEETSATGAAPVIVVQPQNKTACLPSSCASPFLKARHAITLCAMRERLAPTPTPAKS